MDLAFQKNASDPKSREVVFIVGPTASGKSEIGLELANLLKTDIISADSQQVYRQLNIGTAKPTQKQQHRVKHHLIDVVDPDQPFSVGKFKKLGEAVIEGLLQKQKIPLVVGGTGLYLRVLTRGLWDGPAADWALRKKLQTKEKQGGEGTLHEYLSRVDPESAKRIHKKDLVKIIRALEVYTLSGKTLTHFQRNHRFSEKRYKVLLWGLNWSREALYRRIERRVDEMLDQGLVDEVQGLLRRNFDAELPSMRALGYRQVVPYIEGKITYQEMVRVLKRDTKRFAKRQLTWFRKEPGIHWIDLDPNTNPEKIARNLYNKICQHIQKGGSRTGLLERSIAC